MNWLHCLENLGLIMEVCSVDVLHSKLIVYTGYCGASLEGCLSLSHASWLPKRFAHPRAQPGPWSLGLAQPWNSHFLFALPNSQTLLAWKVSKPCSFVSWWNPLWLAVMERGFWLKTFSGLLIAFKKPAIAFKDLWRQAWTAFFQPIKQRVVQMDVGGSYLSS